MTEPAERPSLQVELVPAALEQEAVLANLLELYAHDFSEFHDLDIEEDGRFGYRDLPSYWREPDRHPFLVKVNGKLAGLVLVKQMLQDASDKPVWDVAEFFVLRGYRRRGIGSRIAQEVWRRFPGPWQVRVMESNVSAHRFWAGAIAKFVGEAVAPVRLQKGDEIWNVYLFRAGPPC